MSAPIADPVDDQLLYPDDDGNPMAENTLQFEWIVTIEGGLEGMYRHCDDVFVAGDLLWYAVEGQPALSTAPDIMVAFGRPKGRRGSYMQWVEGGIAPQVVFEILSPRNRSGEMAKKFEFYQRHGVEEYYIYDPDNVLLTGFRRIDGKLQAIDLMDGWVSPLLGIKFDMSGPKLVIWQPNGERFLTNLEKIAAWEQALQQAEQQRLEADQAKHRAEEERQRADRLAARLRELGINPDS